MPRSMFLAVIVGIAAACGGPTEPRSGRPGLTINVVRYGDTIGAIASVVVTVKDETGTPIPEPFVWFESPAVGPDDRYMLAVGSLRFGARAWVRGNATGNVSVLVTANTFIGDAPLRIWNEADDTVIVLPLRRGRSASMHLEPSHPAVHEGATKRIRAIELDRGGNPDTVSARFAALGDAFTVTEDGLVTGVEVGADSIRAWADGFEVRTVLSVVPEGRLSTFVENGPYRYELRTIDVDGSDERVLHTRPFDGYVAPSYPVFSSDGRRVLFRSANGFHELEPGRGERVLAWDPWRPHPTQMAHAMPGSDRWVVPLREGYPRLALLGPDSAALDLVPDASEGAPDPEGRRLVVRNREGLLVVDLETGERTPLGVDGTRPSWSPGGGWIAFENRGVNVIRPDGSGRRGPFSTPTYINYTWLPGERWLAFLGASGFVRGSHLFVVDVLEGIVIPIPPWLGANSVGGGEPSPAQY